MIEVINFTKRYGEFVAVDNLSFTIGKGEIFGFIGPNGAGKSTTIRFLATLLRPTSGEGRVAGFSVTTEPMSVRRVIGFMPDDFGVYDGMKVWEFLDFFAVAYEIPRSYRKKIIGEVLDLLDLTHKRDDYVNGLSKGMKQRLCLAKTLVHDPPVLILDEPASGLDPRARLEMKALLNELKQMGKTILISSHILSELADFCTSIGVIERGKMLAAGNIQEIQAQIRSHRVLKVRVLDDSTERAAELLRGSSSIRMVETYDHTVTAEFEGQDQDMAGLLDRLVSSGVAVHSFAEEPLSLEEVFMMITKGIVEFRPGILETRMLFRDNPVLIRELLVTLRSPRSFVLQMAYVSALGAVVYFQWPSLEQGMHRVNPAVARGLFDLFFLGQFFLVALMAPTFAAGSITGEKERKTYELLLASPLRPSTILVGKLLSSLSYLVILIVSSLPLMILCYLLGGLLLSEITRSYLVLILAAGTFGLVSVACSSYFRRTSSALVVSYLVILPLAVLCVVMTRTDNVSARDFVSIAVLPPWCLAAWTVLGILVNRRLLHPPDVGSEGKDVIDEEEEMKYAIGVVIDRDLFPDKLFAPAKRTDLMPDGTNPVLDKELRSEIFSQGTLMLRVVIQVSMLLSIPLMAFLLFLRSDKAAYYVAYVLTFNLLVGPVFSSGSITQERERQTLSLLLTTLLGPFKIVFAKLLAALRVSTVLTFLLTEQLLLAYVLLPELRNRFWTLAVYLLIIATTCMATSTIGLMCSALARRTASAMVMTYLTLLVLFVLPIGLQGYSQMFASVTSEQLAAMTVTSPFSAALSVPMHTTRSDSWMNQPVAVADQTLVPITRNIRMPVYAVFLCIYPVLGFGFFCVAYLAFRWRWWRAGGLG